MGQSGGAISWVFGMTQLWIELQSPAPLVNTLTTTPMDRFMYVNENAVIQYNR